MGTPRPAIIEDEHIMAYFEQKQDVSVEPRRAPSLMPTPVTEQEDNQQTVLPENDKIILAFLKKAGVADIYDTDLNRYDRDIELKSHVPVRKSRRVLEFEARQLGPLWKKEEETDRKRKASLESDTAHLETPLLGAPLAHRGDRLEHLDDLLEIDRRPALARLQQDAGV